jgi:hypothetical protein
MTGRPDPDLQAAGENPPADAERRVLSFVPERFFDDTTHRSFLAEKVGFFWRDSVGRRLGLWRWEQL